MKRGPRPGAGAESKFQNKGAPWRSEGGGGGRREFSDRGGERRDFGGGGGGGRDFGGGDRGGSSDRGSRDFGGGEQRRDSGDRPQRSTYRRDGGPNGGYGRPSFRGNDTPRDGGFNTPKPQAQPQAFVPRGPVPVPARKLVEGVAQANKALADLIEKFGKSIRGDYDISELQVTVSFDAEGRFIGFGAGGAASMVLSVTPLDAEDILGEDGLDDDSAAAPAPVQVEAADADEDEGDDESDDEDSDDDEEGDDEDSDDEDEDEGDDEEEDEEEDAKSKN